MTTILTILTGVYRLILGGKSTAESFGIDLNTIWGPLRTGLFVLAAYYIANSVGPFAVAGIVVVADFGRRYLKDYS